MERDFIKTTIAIVLILVSNPFDVDNFVLGFQNPNMNHLKLMKPFDSQAYDLSDGDSFYQEAASKKFVNISKKLYTKANGDSVVIEGRRLTNCE